MIEVKSGQVWQYKDKKYHVDSTGKMKIATKDVIEWIDCVTYRSLKDGCFYTQAIEGFIAKFELVG